MSTSVTVPVAFLLARCDGSLTLLMDRSEKVAVGTAVDAFVGVQIAKTIQLMLENVRRLCAVAGFIVLKSDNGAAAEALFVDEWNLTHADGTWKLEMIFLEHGYDKPLRNIHSPFMLKAFVKQTEQSPTSDSPDVVPATSEQSVQAPALAAAPTVNVKQEPRSRPMRIANYASHDGVSADPRLLSSHYSTSVYKTQQQ
ncbi:hypothetical protein AAVH_21079 [Aphelenchoides avenae]|nr:hypothetical protein AAVH_21079 [Aphelenchus avenae]